LNNSISFFGLLRLLCDFLRHSPCKKNINSKDSWQKHDYRALDTKGPLVDKHMFFETDLAGN